MKHPVDAVLLEHAPRGVGDPLYVPWWAKARGLGYSFRLADGTKIEDGRVVLYSPQPRASSAREVPSVASERPSVDVGRIVDEHRGRSEREALCRRYGIDTKILDAPNAGVQSMRLRNALRRILETTRTETV